MLSIPLPLPRLGSARRGAAPDADAEDEAGKTQLASQLARLGHAEWAAAQAALRALDDVSASLSAAARAKDHRQLAAALAVAAKVKLPKGALRATPSVPPSPPSSLPDSLLGSLNESARDLTLTPLPVPLPPLSLPARLPSPPVLLRVSLASACGPQATRRWPRRRS